eukprot:403363324
MQYSGFKVVIYIYKLLQALKGIKPAQLTYKNREDFLLVALLIDCFIKACKNLYKKKRAQLLSKHRHIPKSDWRNNCPIILVHGFAGQTTDKNYLFRGYFHNSFKADICGDNNQELYEADVSPFGSLHDRACELYQQIVGIVKIREEAYKKDMMECEVVYGKEHVHKEHNEIYYKPRYLKRVKEGKIYAYPNGLPGGWCKHRKVHMVGHSWGAQTIRYMQYLMANNYFKNPGYVKCCKDPSNFCFNPPTFDTSNFIASITCLNPVLNGSLGGYASGYQEENRLFKKGKDDLVPQAMKFAILIQNIFSKNQTLNQPQEVIKHELKMDGEIVYELDYQKTNLMYDFQCEIYGLNRKHNETVFQYLRRMRKNDFFYISNDGSACQFAPHFIKDINELIVTQDHTYYFSVTCNLKGTTKHKIREVYSEIKKTVDLGLGFDVDVDQNIKFTKTHQKYPRKKLKLGWLEKKFMGLKIFLSPIALHMSLFCENFLDFVPPKKECNNLLSSEMNNVEAIDYINKDWTSNHDTMLPRYTQEFPRVQTSYQTKNDLEHKPWGTKSDPIFINYQDDAYLEHYTQKDKYQKGVWYYGSYQHVDHLDFCGLPPFFDSIRTLLGIEYRPLFWINLFNRLRTLTIEDQDC